MLERRAARQRDGASGAWRVSLQLSSTGERLGFASLEELFAYLGRLSDLASLAVERECADAAPGSRE